MLSIPVIGLCQDTIKEFNLYAGLLYSSTDMQALKKTADSLNLRYLQCVPNPQYHSWPQTEARCYTLLLEEQQLPLLEAQLQKEVSLNDLIRTIPRIKVKDTAQVVLAYRHEYDEYEKKNEILLYYGNGEQFDHATLTKMPGNQQWVYVKDGFYMQQQLQAVKVFLLDKPFATMPLPQEYAKMIQYVDCMVDTSTVVMLAKGHGDELNNKPFNSLLEYVRQRKHPELASGIPYSLPEDSKKFIVDEYPKNKRLHQLLDDAVKDALKNGNGGDLLESTASGIYSQDTILLMMRSRLVVGFCSQDGRPREHASNIAVLASRAHQWPVFIRAHLDIMNDYFSRNSDGNYAQAGRSTYLRELELLDIPARQLLFGSIFRADSMPAGHYYGNLGRIGRAFTESAYTADFEKQVKAFMKDKNLDPINQCLFSMLYLSYINWQQDVNVRQEKLTTLKADADTYPAYIKAAIAKLE